MSHGTGTLLLAAILAPALCVQAAPAARTPGASRVAQANETTLALRVETDARAMRPGEAVLVTVTPSRPVSEVRAAWFERPAILWQNPGAETWQGLIGIPVDAKPGTHILSMEASTLDGATALEQVRVRVVAARFATRRLRVNPRFVNPPASAAPRIAEESRVLAEVFAAPPTERAWRGRFSLPVPGPATSAFGRLSIVNGKRRGRHMGVDLKAAEGTPIHSPNHGVVVLAADRYMSGQTVVVDHGGGIFSLFAHLSRMAVEAGDRVERGALIGNVGATGRVTGPHLHWAVRVWGTTVDPLSLVAVLEEPDTPSPAVLATAPAVETRRFFPAGVWYGGGKARAPMLERDARSKKEAWRKDIRQIKALGFNTVRAWIDWASGEPVEGAYQLETLDVLLELAEEERLQLVLQVYMDSAPQWVGSKYPDSLFVSSNGQAIKPETSPGYCRDHPGVRKADTAFYAALAARARRSPAFHGWDLWSEPHVINWANPTWIPNPEFCFCPHTLGRFRGWLEKKYGSLDALNAAWYRRFRSWDEVEPSRMSTILSYTDYIDWKAFIVDKLGEDLRDRYEAVKRVAPSTVVTSHAAGVGLFASPHHWEGQSDDWTMARQVDLYGTSFYPKHSAFVNRDVTWRAALLDFTRSFAYDEGRHGFWVGELQGGFGTISVNVSPTVTPADLKVWTWTALSRGAKGYFYYAWYPMSSGYESGGFGLNHLDGRVTERAKLAGSIAQVVDRNQALFLAARPPRAEVAIIYNPLAHFVGGRQRAAAYGGPQGEVAGIERDSLLGVHRALFPRNVPLDYVHINHLSVEKLRQYKLVFFPYPLMLPEVSARVLAEYVRGGGSLVAEARLAWNNERGYASEQIPGLGLWEVMGAREAAIETAPGGRTKIRWTGSELEGLVPGSELPSRWYKETLEPLGPHARVVAEFEDGAPAAVMATHGKGRTLLLGSYVSAAYQTTPSAETERFFAALLPWAGVRLPIEVSGSTLEARYLETGAGILLFLFNHGKDAAASEVRLRLPANDDTATDITTDRVVALTRSEDGVRMAVELAPGDVQVIRVTR